MFFNIKVECCRDIEAAMADVDSEVKALVEIFPNFRFLRTIVDATMLLLSAPCAVSVQFQNRMNNYPIISV